MPARLPTTAPSPLRRSTCPATTYETSSSVGITAAVAVWRRGRAWLVPSIALMPLYWLLISLAAYRALVQLMVAPYHWEKTEHRPRSPAIPP